MTGLLIEATLELWASSLRDVKARMRPLFTQERVAISAVLDGLLGDSGARPAGCGRRLQEIADHGGNRRFWGAGVEMPMRCATSLAITRWSLWPTMMRFW